MSAAAKSREIVAIAVGDIVPSPDNPRKVFEQTWLEELAASMKSTGQLNACLVRPHPTKKGKYELAAGESRWRASTIAGLDTLDCDVRDFNDEAFTTVLVFENLKRRDLAPLEQARGYQLLLTRSKNWSEHWTIEKIAEKEGVSADYVRDRLRLLTLIPAAQKLVEDGTVPMSHALEIAKCTPTQQKQLLDSDDWDEMLWRETARSSNKAVPRAIVSANELKTAIAEQFAISIDDESTPDLFPELARQVESARADKTEIVLISIDYASSEATSKSPAVLGRNAWRRADGSKGFKTCKHGTQLGVGVKGDVRGQAFAVCTARKECKVHWASEIRQDAQSAKWAAEAKAGASKPRKKSAYEIREAAARARRARFVKAIPKLQSAAREAIAKATTKLGGPLDQLIAEQHNRSLKGKWPKPKAGDIGRGSTPEDFMRMMAADALPQNGYTAAEQWPRAGKLLGIDVAKIVKAANEVPKEKKGKAK